MAVTWHATMRATALLALCCVASVVAVEKVRVFGDRVRHPVDSNEWVRTYVDMPKDHDGDTQPLATGIQMTPGFIRLADQLPPTFQATVVIPRSLNLTVPGVGTVHIDEVRFPYKVHNTYVIRFPQVGRNPFKFASFTYNFNGHIPIGVYDFQHFDMRFFMVEPEWWWGEIYPRNSFTTGPVRCGSASPDAYYQANLPVPLECWPGSPLAAFNIGHFNWGQGSHIYNIQERGWSAFLRGSGVDGVDTISWGLQSGQIAYIEGMFSRDLALTPDIDDCIDFPQLVPKRFNTERLFPTRKCIVAGEKTIKLEYTNFETVPGGCEDLRNGPMVGYVIKPIANLLYPGCAVPEPGSS